MTDPHEAGHFVTVFTRRGEVAPVAEVVRWARTLQEAHVGTVGDALAAAADPWDTACTYPADPDGRKTGQTGAVTRAEA